MKAQEDQYNPPARAVVELVSCTTYKADERMAKRAPTPYPADKIGGIRKPKVCRLDGMKQTIG